MKASERDPRALPTLFVGTLSALLIVLSVLGLEVLYQVTAGSERQRKVVAASAEELERVRAEQLERLAGYRWVDRSKGVVAIPVDRAIELMLNESPR
ncbi:MAG TPA: hypothetical protein VJS92_00665 [Candidatus Polarisedimenticolaceae bacterium]|nr:hypothetical protein [Candidatus Polarisedimenticolaceae bacterium]